MASIQPEVGAGAIRNPETAAKARPAHFRHLDIEKMASSTPTASGNTTANDGPTLQVGDLVVATDKIWAESQTFLHFMRRQTGSRIPLSKGAVFRVSDVIHSSGDFILNLANVFDESTPNGDGDDGHARQLLRSESLIFCSKGDEKKLQVLERASAEAAADTQADASNTDDDAAEGSDSPQGNDGSGDEDNANGEANHQSDDDDDEEEEPTLLMGSAPYQDIVRLLYRGLDLPIDVANHMTKFLQIKDIVKSEITVTRASSTRGDYPLSSILGNEDGTWWISAEGSMESGQGEEYLEFSLSRTGVARRCSYVGLSIPPLPQGPLSVRKFRIDWSYDGKEWTEGCRRYTMETMDMAGMQSFKLEQPIDAAKVRLVCLTNAFTSQEAAHLHLIVWVCSL